MRTITGVLAAAALAAALSSPAYAQGVEVGVRAGMNFAKIGGDDAAISEVEPSNRTGLSIGGFARFGLAPSFSIQPELLYSQKGTEYEDEGATFGFDVSYVDVPVLAVYSPPLSGASPIRPALMAGPVVSFRAGCEVTGELDGISFATDCDESEQELKSTDIGLMFGAGAGMGVGPGTLHLDARYGLGLTSVDDSEESLDMKNRLISLSVGYSMRLGM
ncbi:MAG TPA: porin family protein [Longimicrobiales bacterium]